MELFYKGNAFSPLLFRYRQVSLYVLCSFAFRIGFYVLLFLHQFYRYRVIVDRLRAGRSGVWIPVETRFFSGRIWGPTQSSVYWVAGCFTEGKVARAYHWPLTLPPSNADVSNEWSSSSTTSIRRHGVDRDNGAFCFSLCCFVTQCLRTVRMYIVHSKWLCKYLSVCPARYDCVLVKWTLCEEILTKTLRRDPCKVVCFVCG
jgi:hypothetical protein